MSELLTVCDVASMLRVHERTVRRYLSSGRLRGDRLPHDDGYGEWRITPADVDNFLSGKINIAESTVR